MSSSRRGNPSFFGTLLSDCLGRMSLKCSLSVSSGTRNLNSIIRTYQQPTTKQQNHTACH